MAGPAGALALLSVGYTLQGGVVPVRSALQGERTPAVTAVASTAFNNIANDARRAVVELGSCYLLAESESPDPSRQWYLCATPVKSEEVSIPICVDH